MSAYFNFFKGFLVAASFAVSSLSAVQPSNTDLSFRADEGRLISQRASAVPSDVSDSTHKPAVTFWSFLRERFKEKPTPKEQWWAAACAVFYGVRLGGVWHLGGILRDILMTESHSALYPALTVASLPLLFDFLTTGKFALRGLPFLQSGLLLTTPYLETCLTTAPYTRGALWLANISLGLLDAGRVSELFLGEVKNTPWEWPPKK